MLNFMTTLPNSSETSARRMDLFTLQFPTAVALLEVRGAPSSEDAELIAATSFQKSSRACSYTVSPGDQTRGQATVLYLWCSREAQEAQPLRSRQQATGGKV